MSRLTLGRPTSTGNAEQAVTSPKPRTRRRPSVGLIATLTGWSFAGPATLIVLGLSIFPAAWALVLSFQSWNGFTEPEFVGWDNYTRLLGDEQFGAAVLHTVTYTALFVPASVLGGLGLAVALNRRVRGIGFYRTAIFVPFVTSAAATGILATYLFNPQYGLVNNVLRTLGLPPQGWLEDPSQAMIVIAIMAFWSQAAFTTVIYLAALQDVPADLIEAATLDGANRWQTFWRIIWPQLAPVSLFIVIWQTIGAVQLFDLVYTTTRGGPLDSTKTVVYFLFEQAFSKLEFGYGSAAAYVLFAVTLVATVSVVLITRRNAEETK